MWSAITCKAPSRRSIILIVAHEVTNLGYDRDALAMMAHAARKVMFSNEIEAIADKGYYKGEEIVACEEAGIPVAVPKPHTSNAAAHGRFDRADFIYVGSDDAYVCPAGERLTHRFTNTEAGKTLHSYWTDLAEAAPSKAGATSKERRIRRWEHEGILERVQKRLDESPNKMSLGCQTVEHPFGTIKRGWVRHTSR